MKIGGVFYHLIQNEETATMFTMSKKSWVAGTTFLFMGFFIGFLIFKRGMPPPSSTATAGSIMMPPPPPAPTVLSGPAGGPPAPHTLPLYAGDSIENIGTDQFIKQVPADALARYQAELATLKNDLALHPNNFDEWLRLGVIKQFFNNFIGARDAWEYAVLVAPKNSTAYFNLGGLYGDYLHDFPKAEKDYLKAIENDPKLPYFYTGLADFYWTFDVSKKAQAADVIRRGLVALPDDPALLAALKIYTQ
jgi:tetratricopeptide (TPR) repeat protein